MSWIYLILAIVCEVSGTTCMKLSQGFTKLLPSVLLFFFYACSFTLMTITLRRLEVSVVYAIWSGIGMALISAIGIVVFDETFTVTKVISTGLIVLGVIGLSLK